MSCARLALAALLGGAWAGCGGEPTSKPAPAPDPTPAQPKSAAAPAVAFAPAKRDAATPQPIPMTPPLAAARQILEGVVVGHARNPDNPWAVVHGMLALGPSMRLTNDRDPVDWLFENYAVEVETGGETLITFPQRRGRALIEPHTDLILKGLTEAGLPPDRPVRVAGHDHTLADLYRYSMWRSWAQGLVTGFQEGGYNDSAWALQGLAAWSPPDQTWMADGNHQMSMTGFTTAVIDQLSVETKPMFAAKSAGELMKKDTRVGLFRYTCGGQHVVQGVAYAVARGFGEPTDRQRICDQLDLLVWRIDVELGAIDPLITSGMATPEAVTILLSQRLKFLGHWLETTHKIAAMDLCPLGPEHQAASVRVANELVRTVDGIGRLGIWNDVGIVRTNKAFEGVRDPEQVYLDLVGDSAHAVRGIDLATGRATIRY